MYVYVGHEHLDLPRRWQTHPHDLATFVYKHSDKIYTYIYIYTHIYTSLIRIHLIDHMTILYTISVQYILY